MSQTWKAVTWYFCLGVVLIALSIVAHHLGHPFLAGAIVMIPSSMIVNGWAAQAEDNASSGFNNPSGTSADAANNQVDHRNDPRDPTA